MLVDLKPYIIWIHLHPHWAGAAILFTSFLESLALIGLLFPGIVIMTAIGSLIGSGVLPFTSIALYAIVGAVLGDVVSFWLGYHYHTNIRRMWPFCNYPKLLHKGENFFLRHGGMGVFIGRFVGPIRPLIALIAGMMSMRPARFVIADIIANIAWVLVYLAPGIIVGAASQQLAPKMATQLILGVVTIILILWCVSWVLKKIFVAIIKVINYALAQFWRYIQTSPNLKLIKQILTDPLLPNSHSQITLALLLLISFILFISLTISVMHHGIFTAWNEPVYCFMRGLRSASFDPVMVAITQLNPSAITIMWIAVLIWLFVRRENWSAWHWLTAGILCIGSGELFKHFIKSPRPPGLLQTPAGWSFPSGHTLFSVALLGFLAVMLARNWRRDIRWLIYSGTSLIIFCVMISRLYLGAHWFADIVGAALLGFSIKTIITLSYRRRLTPASLQTVLSTLLIAVLALTISLSWNFIRHFKEDIHTYTPIWVTEILDNKTWWSQAGITEPLYRGSCFGRPIEAMNVEWAGSLNSISYTLTQQQWNLLPKASLSVALNGFTNNQVPHQQLPLLNQLYEDNKPVLVMYKLLQQPQQVLILRLWNAHLQLKDGTPLWVGTVSYHKPWHARFFKKTKEQNNIAPLKLPAASDVLAKDLQNWQWKKIIYPEVDDAVLLVRVKEK